MEEMAVDGSCTGSFFTGSFFKGSLFLSAAGNEEI